MDGRLARRQREATTESLPNAKGSRSPSKKDAGARSRKKTGGPSTVAAVCRGWAATQKWAHQKAPAIALANLLGNAPLGAIRGDHLNLIITGWKASKSPLTVYTYSHELRRLLRAIRPELEASVPKTKRRMARRPLLEPGELPKLLAVAEPWLRALIIIAKDTGLRISDCRRLSQAHCDATLNTVTIEMQKTKATVRIPIGPDLKAVIENAPPGDAAAPIVDRYAGKILHSQTAHLALRRAIRKAGTNPRITWHSFRHTIAVDLYQVSKDLAAVQQLLGHESMHTTTRYLEHADPGKLRPLLEQLWHPAPERKQ